MALANSNTIICHNLPGPHLYTWVESSNVDKLPCWRTKVHGDGEIRTPGSRRESRVNAPIYHNTFLIYLSYLLISNALLSRDANMPKHAFKACQKELRRLKKMPSAMPEYAMTRNYLELMVELPWSKESTDTLDIKQARQVIWLNLVLNGKEVVMNTKVSYLLNEYAKQGKEVKKICICDPSLGSTFCKVMYFNICDRRRTDRRMTDRWQTDDIWIPWSAFGWRDKKKRGAKGDFFLLFLNPLNTPPPPPAYMPVHTSDRILIAKYLIEAIQYFSYKSIWVYMKQPCRKNLLKTEDTFELKGYILFPYFAAKSWITYRVTQI